MLLERLLDQLIAHPYEYMFIFVVTFCIYFFLLRKFIFCIFDSYFYSNIICSCFATSTVIFSYMKFSYNPNYIVNYFLSIVAFYLIFLSFGRKVSRYDKLTYSNSMNKEYRELIILDSEFVCFFYFLILFKIIYQAYSYSMFGIPLFMSSRHEIKLSGGILNSLLIRCDYFVDPISKLMMFYIIYFGGKKQKLVGRIYFVIVIVISLLSGSKSALLDLIFVFGFFAYFTQDYNKSAYSFITSRKIYLMLGLVVLATLGAITLQTIFNKSGFSALQALIFRFAATGDGYIYAYPNGIIEKMNKRSLIDFLFGEFLYTFRLQSEDRPQGFGFQLYCLSHNILKSNIGPNPRMNLVGYAYFGFWGNVYLALFSGIVFTYFRNRLIDAKNKPPVFQILVYYFYLIINNIETDIQGVIDNFNTNFIFHICFIVPVFIIIEYLKPRKKYGGIK